MSATEIWIACLLWAFAGYMWGRHRNTMLIENLRMEISSYKTLYKMIASNDLTPEGMRLLDQVIKEMPDEVLDRI